MGSPLFCMVLIFLGLSKIDGNTTPLNPVNILPCLSATCPLMVYLFKAFKVSCVIMVDIPFILSVKTSYLGKESGKAGSPSKVNFLKFAAVLSLIPDTYRKFFDNL